MIHKKYLVGPKLGKACILRSRSAKGNKDKKAVVT